MSDDEKLQAIKDKARKEKAGKAQASIAEKRKSNRNKKENLIPWVAASIAVILALSYLYLSKEPEEPERSANYIELANSMVEYQREAFKVAAARELIGRGIHIDDPSAVQSERLSDELFVFRFRSNEQDYRLRGNYICESLELASEKRQDPDCYLWQ